MSTTIEQARSIADHAARVRTQPSDPGPCGVIGDGIDLGDWWAFDWGVEGSPFTDTAPICVAKATGQVGDAAIAADASGTATLWSAPTGGVPIATVTTNTSGPITFTLAAQQAPASADAIPTDGPPLHGVLAPEGIRTGDGRSFSDGSMRWRDLPLPLMVQNATAPGHDGAVRVARIDEITRDTSGPITKIRFSGTWATDATGALTEAAVAARGEVQSKVLRGVSVDLDDTTVEFLDAETGKPMNDDDETDLMEMMFGEPPLMNVVDGRISGATMCSIPAFQQAYVADGVYTAGVPEPGDEDFEPIETAADAVVASAFSLAASLTPVYAASDFADPGLTGPTPLTVADDGRVFGHLATWGTCHIGIDGVCITPPMSLTNYAHFAKGVAATEDGPVAVGPITVGTGHATPGASLRAATEHYDNTGSVAADVAIGEDAIGIWVAGRLRASATEDQITALRHGGALSGDWRRVGGNLELVAALAVNTPGFPIPRTAIAASAGVQESLVASGIVVGRWAEGVWGETSTREIRREVLAALDRRTKVARIASRIGRDKASRVAAASALIEEV